MDAGHSPRMIACGLFRRRRSRSTSSIPRIEHGPATAAGKPQAQHAGATRRQHRRWGSDEEKNSVVPVIESRSSAPRPQPAKASPAPTPAKPAGSGKGLMADLDSMLGDRRRADGSGNLVRVSSGNVMVYGNLGNLRGGNSNFKNPPDRNVFDYLPKTAKELSTATQVKAKRENIVRVPATVNRGMGNIVRAAAKETTTAVPKPAPESELCRALSRRLDPEELKDMGNEEYKKGRFAEAMALYEQAIVMDPGKASYYSNKAAALAGMDRLFEAVGDCKEAIRIDPAYLRAHHRLATLYLRLGEAEKAIHHYKQSRNEAAPNDMSRAKALLAHISKSNEARRLKDYITLLKESQSAASSGADSSPQVFALQAEALLKLQRHEEADSIMSCAPKFAIVECTKFFGATGSSYFLMIQAQVDMAAGRFEDAVAAAQKAAQLDPSNREISAVARRTRAAAAARSRGNDLFMAGKFAEACVAYGDGLNHDAHNAVLLCNRAACRSKLGHYEKAVEDCNTALAVRPSYSKARRRRADCNAKLERWEASLKDYEVLIQENPGDDELSRSLSEAQAKLKRQQAEEFKDKAES
ncbi:inactive TPR repeat-containing thioredoxin TTL3 [Canna indica]|uniref:Inactive TPR repeat-containing thioredoxin TTL3 n=1 Tax=Canna indica TaxID=4628 RepID=A0AAQ3KSV8_9LILI|nr:inactive TPR repeat-containing thioredoxin TTL3 [Canna indica]